MLTQWKGAYLWDRTGGEGKTLQASFPSLLGQLIHMGLSSRMPSPRRLLLYLWDGLGGSA